jgi:hypothetical protein
VAEPEALINACNALDALAQAIVNSIGDDRTFQDIWGWNCPPINRHEFADIPRRLASRLRELAPEQIDSDLESKLNLIPARLQSVQTQTMQYLTNGNAAGAAPVITTTLDWVSSFVLPYLPPLVDWQDVDEQKLMPRALLRRLRSVDAQIATAEAKAGNVGEAMRVIMDAHSAAEALPTDMASLSEAREAVEIAGKSAAAAESASVTSSQLADSCLKRIEVLEREAQKLVENCEDAFSAATTKGLGEAFSIRADRLGMSMWVWVGGLLIALGIGGWLSHERVQKLQELASATQPDLGALWVNITLAILSIAAPAWFAWISTKQIGQRFRLAEDYAFKASVAKAYAGYSREAARVDPAFAARLFGSALNRIDEAPLRFVEMENHGSPFHEFIRAWLSRKKEAPPVAGSETL